MDADSRLDLIDSLTERFLLRQDGGWFPEEQWPELLREPCAGDELLTSEVCAYARAVRDEPAEQPAVLISLPQPFEAGRCIGRYEIKRFIGRGGMGEVYEVLFRAERYSEARALKLIKRIPHGISAEAYLRRIHVEEALIASLSHPNIIRILDDGTDSGHPFFVMELVEGGAPIDEYCDTRHLNLEERLKLFNKVCAAIQYAHSKNVLHKDLKPSNILVSAQGEVKVLDFGIATVSSPDAQRPTVVRQFPESSLLGGTPVYMSPEQCAGHKLDQTTDVYSLGAVLQDIVSKCPEYAETNDASSRIRTAIDLVIFNARRPTPRDRYASVEALAVAVDKLLVADETPRASNVAKRPARWVWISPVVVLTISIGAWLLYTKKFVPLKDNAQSPQDHQIRSHGFRDNQKDDKTANQPGINDNRSARTGLENRPHETKADFLPSAPVDDTSPKQSFDPLPGEEASLENVEDPRANSAPSIANLSTIEPKHGNKPPIAVLSPDGTRIVSLELVDGNNSLGDRKYRAFLTVTETATRRVVAESDSVPIWPGSFMLSDNAEYMLKACTFIHFDFVTGKAVTLPEPPNCTNDHIRIYGISNRGDVTYSDGRYLYGFAHAKPVRLAFGGACFRSGDMLIPPNRQMKCEVSPLNIGLNNNMQYFLLSSLSKSKFPQQVSRGRTLASDYTPLTVVDEGKTLVGERSGILFLADASTGELLKYGLLSDDNSFRSEPLAVLFASRSSNYIIMYLKGSYGLYQWSGHIKQPAKPLKRIVTPGDGEQLDWNVSSNGKRVLSRGHKQVKTFEILEK